MIVDINEYLEWARLTNFEMKKLNKNVRDFITNRKIGMADEEISAYEELQAKWDLNYSSLHMTENKHLRMAAIDTLKILYEQEHFIAKKVYAECFGLYEEQF